MNVTEIANVTKEKTELAVTKLDKLSIKEIESYGSEVQLEITDTVDKILENTKCINLSKVGKDLNELSVTANKATNSLKGGLVAVRVRKWIGQFQSVENKLSSIEDGLIGTKNRLNDVLNGLIDSKDFILKQTERLQELENNLNCYYEELKNSESTDSLRLQAVANRLKTLTTFRVVTEQESIKTVLVISENKEITHQLEEAVTNLLPMFKIQMMNTIALKAHREALDIKKQLEKVANSLIVDNAKEISKAADELIENRKSSLIDPKNIEEANTILQNTIEKVAKAAFVEADGNMDVVVRLQKSAESLKKMSNLAIEEEWS